MGYHGRKGPIDYKGYGQKKKPVRKTRISMTGILLILFVGGLFVWFVTSDGTQEEVTPLPGVTSLKERKNIYGRNLEPLAVSFDLYAAYIKPLEVKDSLKTGETLAAILNLDRDQLVKRLRTERSFIWLGQQVPQEKVAELSQLDIPGLFFQKSPVRFYPNNKTAAQVLGYVKDEQGLAGIELFYDKELRGRTIAGLGSGGRDKTIDESKHIVLTLDLKTQTILEKQMALLLDKTQASSVAAMAVNPATGEIVASVQLPSFNPNSFWEATPQSQKMEMVSKAINPGGISGLFRYGAAIHAGKKINLNMSSPQSATVIKPRLQKSGGRSRAGYWWPWAGGGFISTELAELPDPTITGSELLAFQQDLGISCADKVDMPVNENSILSGGECSKGRLNGISILGGFSRLINGGKPVTLHFLKGMVDEAGTFSSYDFEATGGGLEKVSAVMKKSFAASAGQKASFFAAEYLFPLEKEDDFVVEGQEGGQRSEVFTRGQVFDGVLVAASPVNKPNLALLIAVQEGEFDLSSASPMRRFGDNFFRIVAKERQGDSGVDLENTPLPAEGPLLATWQKLNKKEDIVTEEQEVKQGKMPKVVGMSLRKALLELMPCQVEIEIEGAGRVVEQQPAFGESCGDRVLLKLASDNVERQTP